MQTHSGAYYQYCKGLNADHCAPEDGWVRERVEPEKFRAKNDLQAAIHTS